MKVLLVALNAKYIHSSLALRYLKAYLDSLNSADPDIPKTEVLLKEYSINNHLPDILSDIYPLRPDVIGLACYIWNIEETLKLASLFKKTLPGVKIALGGPEVSYGFSFDCGYVDYVVSGEGEKTFAALVNALKNNGDCQNIPGLSRRQDGRTAKIQLESDPQLNQACFIENLDDIPFPYKDGDMVALRDKIIYYESSRGCPFSCRYCLSGASRGVRFFSQERVLRDLAFFIRHEVAQVKFVDRTFNAVKKHYLPILRFLAGQNCRTNFHFEAAADLWDEEGLAILKEAPPGRFQLEIGVQSTHPPTLQAVSRHHDFVKIAANVGRIAACGNIHLHLDLIAGLPHENMASFAKSFNDVYALSPDMLQIGFLKLLKGSPLRQSTAEHGYVFTDGAPYEVLSNNYLNYGEIRKLKLLEKVFNLIYNSSRFRYTLQWLVPKKMSAFPFYEKLAFFWEEQGFELASHSPVALYRFVADFCRKYYPEDLPLCLEFLKFDYLLSQRNASRPDFLLFNDSPTQESVPVCQKWREQKNSFWQDTSLTRRYLPDFTFTTWREIKKNYHIEVFAADIPAFVQNKPGWENRPTAVLFSYGEKPAAVFQPIDIL